MTHPFTHNLDAALPGLSAADVIGACTSGLRTLGLGQHRTVRTVLAQGMSRATARDYDAAMTFIAQWIAPVSLDDVTSDAHLPDLRDNLQAAISAAQAVMIRRRVLRRMVIEVAA